MAAGWMHGRHALVWAMAVPLLGPAATHAGEARPGPAGVERTSSATSGGNEVVRRGTAVAGSRVSIGPDDPIPPGAKFLWEQVEGPTVPLADPTSPKIRFTVPDGARQLAFLLTVRDEGGERTTRVVVPVDGEVAGPRPAPSPPTPAQPAARPSANPGPALLADGGDDQIGLVGRRITLNGTASRPMGQVGYRWIQISGPAPSQGREDGGYYSFVPTAAGVYRFALVVGHQSRVSEPDLITVEVGQSPAAAPAPDGPSSRARSVAAGVAAIPQGMETASQVADVLESVAERASLYNSVGELQSELTRRLDVVIPNAPAVRAAWSSQVFIPLSQYVAVELAAAGVDPRQAPDDSRPLDRSQRDRIRALFRELAGAFRPQRIQF